MPMVLFSLLVAFVLNALALPEALRIWRPEFVLMCTLYWLIHLTPRFGLGWAWCMGLLMDVLTQSHFGVHALAFLVVGMVAWRNAVQLRMVGHAQSLLAITGLLLLAVLVEQLLALLTGAPRGLGDWARVLPSLLFWPLIAWLLGRIRAGVEMYP